MSGKSRGGTGRVQSLCPKLSHRHQRGIDAALADVLLPEAFLRQVGGEVAILIVHQRKARSRTLIRGSLGIYTLDEVQVGGAWASAAE